MAQADVNTTLVVALFADLAAARTAAEALAEWDHDEEAIALGPRCLLAKDARGEVVYERLDEPEDETGHLLGLIAGAVVGGVTPAPGRAEGVAASVEATYDSVAERLEHAAERLFGRQQRDAPWEWGFSSDDLQRVADELTAGRAAVLVLCGRAEATATAAALAELGGAPEHFALARPPGDD